MNVTVVVLLGVLAGVCAVIGLLNAARAWPFVAIAALLLSIAIVLLGGGIH